MYYLGQTIYQVLFWFGCQHCCSKFLGKIGTKVCKILETKMTEYDGAFLLKNTHGTPQIMCQANNYCMGT